MTENAAVIKIIAQHTKDYNELSVKYKRLYERYRLLERDYTVTAEDYTSLHSRCKKTRGENKKLKVLLQVAKKEIQAQRIDFAKDLKDLPYKFKEAELKNGAIIKSPQVLYTDWFNILKKYEAKE